ncbi:MAG: Gfo/Idh/MocA family oxidoreductase [Kiritimatiellales bacterium]
MYKAAIIGISGYGNVHYTELKREAENGAAVIAAAAVINQDEEKEKCDWLRSQGAELFTDYHEMLNRFRDQIDICFIPTGIALHAEMSIAAMRAGANVYVEKPIAATIQEVREIQQVSRETGKFVAVGYQFIYQPGIHQIKQLLLDGVLGELKSFKGRATTLRNSAYYARNHWAGKLKANGRWVLDSPFNNAHAHYLHLLCFFAGKEFGNAAEIKTVQAELYKANAIENADTACMRIETAGGAPICFYSTQACSVSRLPDLMITGEKGRLILDIASPEAVIELNDGTVRTLPRTPVKEHYRHLFDALCRRLADPAAFICDLDIAVSQTLCCNGAHESSAVHAIPSQYKSKKKEESGAMHIEIENIEQIIDRAFDEEKLFSELDVDWAQPGIRVPMTGYEQFTGGNTGE